MPLWYTFSCALSITKSVKWWELGSSIGSFVSTGSFPLPYRPLSLSTLDENVCRSQIHNFFAVFNSSAEISPDIF